VAGGRQVDMRMQAPCIVPLVVADGRVRKLRDDAALVALLAWLGWAR
jgi:hypothetical protein